MNARGYSAEPPLLRIRFDPFVRGLATEIERVEVRDEEALLAFPAARYDIACSDQRQILMVRRTKLETELRLVANGSGDTIVGRDPVVRIDQGAAATAAPRLLGVRANDRVLGGGFLVDRQAGAIDLGQDNPVGGCSSRKGTVFRPVDRYFDLGTWMLEHPSPLDNPQHATGGVVDRFFADFA